VKNKRLAALGQQIRRLRETRNISQEEFAAQAGLDRAYYGGIERGERNVAALNLIKIAVTLGSEVGELFPSLSALRRL
jgi:transcriptional regulator with XRE-family HTH domain